LAQIFSSGVTGILYAFHYYHLASANMKQWRHLNTDARHR